MLSNWHPAPDALAPVLAGIWSVHAPRDEAISARVLPDGSTCLVFQRDGTILRSCDDAWSPWAATCVSGPRTGPFDFSLNPSGQILIVQLRPAGAMQALGVSMSSLADRSEDLAAVVGSGSRDLAEQVLGGVDDRSCVRAVEQWLLDRIRTNRARCDVTDAVVAEIVRHAGSIRVEDVAAYARLSRRHLGRIMRERVGVSPKQFARITRFDHAVQVGRFSPSLPWSRVALDAGFADQAHMAREFAVLGGIRPSDMRGAGAALIW